MSNDAIDVTLCEKFLAITYRVFTIDRYRVLKNNSCWLLYDRYQLIGL